MSKRKEIRPTDSRKSRGLAKPDVIMPAPESLAGMPEGYSALLAGIKERIAHERIKAVLSANTTMVLMYWDIGRSILERQHKEGWGAKVIDRLSHDLKTAFPDMTGFSPRNLKYMRTFAEAWPDRAIVQRTVAQLPWRSNLTLLDKLSDPETRLWYAHKALELGQGFAFVGRQVHLEIGDSDFFLDLLFYHLHLRCYVVIELKAGKFEPGHISQLNMYLNAVDGLLRHSDDKPSIGLLLVKDKNQTMVEYSLAGYTKPIGVAKWERYITQSLPDDLKSSLPSVEEIEAELSEIAVVEEKK